MRASWRQAPAQAAFVSVVAAAVVPHPPALLPGVTGQPIAEVEDVRTRAGAAVQWVFDTAPDLVIAISAGKDSAHCSFADVSSGPGFVATAGDPGDPLGLAVLAALAPASTAVPTQAWTVRADASAAAAAELGVRLADGASRVGLLVAGDGSARRGPKAPGYLDPRATPFDADVERALGSGDAAALLALDRTLADELLVAGRAAWQVLAGAVGDAAVTAMLDYAGDPFGVWYAVARWQVERVPA